MGLGKIPLSVSLLKPYIANGTIAYIVKGDSLPCVGVIKYYALHLDEIACVYTEYESALGTHTI